MKCNTAVIYVRKKGLSIHQCIFKISFFKIFDCYVLKVIRRIRTYPDYKNSLVSSFFLSLPLRILLYVTFEISSFFLVINVIRYLPQCLNFRSFLKNIFSIKSFIILTWNAVVLLENVFNYSFIHNIIWILGYFDYKKIYNFYIDCNFNN